MVVVGVLECLPAFEIGLFQVESIRHYLFEILRLSLILSSIWNLEQVKDSAEAEEKIYADGYLFLEVATFQVPASSREPQVVMLENRNPVVPKMICFGRIPLVYGFPELQSVL